MKQEGKRRSSMNAIDPSYGIRERACYGLGEQESKKRQVTALLAPFRQSNNVVASLLLTFDLAGFLASTSFLIQHANSWTAPLSSLLIALFMTRLFIIGHDCCHGSFFSGSKANAIFGRLTMLPGLARSAHGRWDITRYITVTPVSAAAISHGSLYPPANTSRCRDPNGSSTGSAARFPGSPFIGCESFGGVS